MDNGGQKQLKAIFGWYGGVHRRRRRPLTCSRFRRCFLYCRPVEQLPISVIGSAARIAVGGGQLAIALASDLIV